MSLVAIDAVKSKLYWRAWIKFYPHFLQIYSDVSKIRWKECPQKCTEYLYAPRETAQLQSGSIQGCKLMRAKVCARLFFCCTTDVRIELLNISVFWENQCGEDGTILMGVSKIVFTHMPWDITIIRKNKRLRKVHTLHPGLQHLWSLLLGDVLKRRGGVDWLIYIGFEPLRSRCTWVL
jgi:hypothetical protein